MKELFFSALAGLLIASCSPDEPVRQVREVLPKSDSLPVPEPLVKPPVADFDPAFEEMEVEVSKGAELRVKNSKGSVILIPPNVLVFDDRAPVLGDVTLFYREFHHAADVYCAGIPMDYDASGMMKRFETAGMFELRAFQNGKEVFVDSGKTIEVTFAGNVSGGDYHFFYLDEKLTRNWHYVGDEGGIPNPEKEKIRRRKKEKVLQIPLGPGYFSFNYMAALDVMMNDNVALINKNRSDPNTRTKISDYGITWSNIYNYQSINYEGKTYLASMLVWKNLSGTAFPEWVGKADSKLTHLSGNVYELELFDKSGNTHRAKIEAFMSLKSLFAFSAQQWKNKYEETIRRVREDEKRLTALADVYRTMEINAFGIYNYDRFLNDENSVTVKATFKFDRDPGVLQNQEVCYVSGSGRSLVKYPYDKWHNFILLPDASAQLFALLPDHYIALFDAKKYAAIDQKKLRMNLSPEMVFELVTIRKISGAEDLKSVLGIE